MGRALKDFAIGRVQYRYVIRAVTTASGRFDEVRVVDARSGQTTRVILARASRGARYGQLRRIVSGAAVPAGPSADETPAFQEPLRASMPWRSIP